MSSILEVNYKTYSQEGHPLEAVPIASAVNETKRENIVPNGKVAADAKPVNYVCPYRATCDMRNRIGNGAQKECERMSKKSSNITDIEDLLTAGTVCNGTVCNGTACNGTVYNRTFCKGSACNGNIGNGTASNGIVGNGTANNKRVFRFKNKKYA